MHQPPMALVVVQCRVPCRPVVPPDALFRDRRVHVEQLAAGETWESILEGYPEISREDIRAAIEAAKSAIDHTEIVPSGAG